jgi:hypothetical protein
MLPASLDEVAWRCEQCGSGWHLDEANAATCLAPLTVQFDARLDPRAQGRPFWVAEGRVSVQRETYSGNQSREAQEFWNQPRRFCVPAYTCPLETLVSLGAELLRKPPELRPGPPAPFLPVTLPRADVSDMAEFVVVGVEADRRDKLRSVNFRLELGSPELWIFP